MRPAGQRALINAANQARAASQATQPSSSRKVDARLPGKVNPPAISMDYESFTTPRIWVCCDQLPIGKASMSTS